MTRVVDEDRKIHGSDAIIGVVESMINHDKNVVRDRNPIHISCTEEDRTRQ